MGLLTEEPTSEPEFPGPDADTGVAAYSEAGRAPLASPGATSEPAAPPAVAGVPSSGRRWFAGSTPEWKLRPSEWLFRSYEASALWLLVRLWLGYQWLNAGYQKIWGAEKSAFWFGNGVGVKGFATAGVAGSAGGKSGAMQTWDVDVGPVGIELLDHELGPRSLPGLEDSGGTHRKRAFESSPLDIGAPLRPGGHVGPSVEERRGWDGRRRSGADDEGRHGSTMRT